MNPLILFAVVGVAFGLAPILLRSNAVYILLALAAGELLARLTSQDVTQIANSTLALNVPMLSIVQMILLLFAPLLILLMFKNSVKSSGIFLQVVPATATALLAVMLIVAKLPYDQQDTIQGSEIYLYIKPFFGLAIAAGLMVSMFYLAGNRPKHNKDKKHKK